MVFDEFVRADRSVAKYGESRSDFLNRIDSEYWAEVRRLIEEWASHLDGEAYDDIEGESVPEMTDTIRLPSGNCIFTRLYCERDTRSNAIPRLTELIGVQTSLRMDFGQSFYLEATLASTSSGAMAAQNRLNSVFDSLNDIVSPNFYLRINVHSEGASGLATTRLKSELERWLGTLNPDDVVDQYRQARDLRQISHLDWKDEGSSIEFRPLPKPKASG